MEGVHAVNRPDRRSGPDELTRLLAVQRTDREELAHGHAAEGWASAGLGSVYRTYGCFHASRQASSQCC